MRRRIREIYKLQTLADGLGIHKSIVSRWFRGAIQPNWTVDTIADIAYELNLHLEVIATDRQTGEIFTSSGARPARITVPIGQSAVDFVPRGTVSFPAETIAEPFRRQTFELSDMSGVYPVYNLV